MPLSGERQERALAFVCGRTVQGKHKSRAQKRRTGAHLNIAARESGGGINGGKMREHAGIKKKKKEHLDCVQRDVQ